MLQYHWTINLIQEINVNEKDQTEKKSSLASDLHVEFLFKKEVSKKEMRTIKRRMKQFAKVNRKGLYPEHIHLPGCSANVYYESARGENPFYIDVLNLPNSGLGVLELILKEKDIIDGVGIYNYLLTGEREEGYLRNSKN